MVRLLDVDQWPEMVERWTQRSVGIAIADLWQRSLRSATNAELAPMPELTSGSTDTVALKQECAATRGNTH